MLSCMLMVLDGHMLHCLSCPTVADSYMFASPCPCLPVLQWDDESGEPTRLVGFDASEPTAHNRGKPQAIARIRQRNPYTTVVMVGDGITDLEAVEVRHGCGLQPWLVKAM